MTTPQDQQARKRAALQRKRKLNQERRKKAEYWRKLQPLLANAVVASIVLIFTTCMIISYSNSIGPHDGSMVIFLLFIVSLALSAATVPAAILMGIIYIGRYGHIE